MADLTDKEINEQIEAAYETLRTAVEQLGKKGASPLTLGDRRSRRNRCERRRTGWRNPDKGDC